MIIGGDTVLVHLENVFTALLDTLSNGLDLGHAGGNAFRVSGLATADLLMQTIAALLLQQLPTLEALTERLALVTSLHQLDVVTAATSNEGLQAQDAVEAVLDALHIAVRAQASAVMQMCATFTLVLKPQLEVLAHGVTSDGASPCHIRYHVEHGVDVGGGQNKLLGLLEYTTSTATANASVQLENLAHLKANALHILVLALRGQAVQASTLSTLCLEPRSKAAALASMLHIYHATRAANSDGFGEGQHTASRATNTLAVSSTAASTTVVSAAAALNLANPAVERRLAALLRTELVIPIKQRTPLVLLVVLLVGTLL